MSSNLPVITPMHPTLVREPFHRDGWVYETKYDGWRMLAYNDGSAGCLVSRRRVDTQPGAKGSVGRPPPRNSRLR